MGEVQDVMAVSRSWCNGGEEKQGHALVDTCTSGQNNKDAYYWLHEQQLQQVACTTY